MITLEKLIIYKNYNGDIDGWARMGNEDEMELMEDEDWFLIDDLLQDITFMKSGRSSDEYNRKITDKLKDNCVDDEVIKELMELADLRSL